MMSLIFFSCVPDLQALIRSVIGSFIPSGYLGQSDDTCDVRLLQCSVQVGSRRLYLERFRVVEILYQTLISYDE